MTQNTSPGTLAFNSWRELAGTVWLGWSPSHALCEAPFFFSVCLKLTVIKQGDHTGNIYSPGNHKILGGWDSKCWDWLSHRLLQWQNVQEHWHFGDKPAPPFIIRAETLCDLTTSLCCQMLLCVRYRIIQGPREMLMSLEFTQHTLWKQTLNNRGTWLFNIYLNVLLDKNYTICLWVCMGTYSHTGFSSSVSPREQLFCALKQAGNNWN